MLALAYDILASYLHRKLARTSVSVCAPSPTEESKNTDISAVSSGSECSKCSATKKNGKRSCCARGGAWFKNCGDHGDLRFDHTWAEGIQACKDFASVASAKKAIRVMIRDEGVILSPLDTQSSNDTKQHTISFSHDDKLDSSAADSRDCARPTIIDVCICVLSTMLFSLTGVYFTVEINT